MEKKMEKMKKEIKTQNRFYLIIRTLQNLCMGLYLVWLL